MNETTDKPMTCGTSPSEKPFLAAASAGMIADFIRKTGEPAYRAKQIYEWIVKHYVTDPASMVNLPKTVREKLQTHFLCGSVTAVKRLESEDGSRKFLLNLHDGEQVECAMIPAMDGRVTFCLSTQVGCPVRCAFCASGSAGFVRDLAAGEIAEEYFLCCREAGKSPDNVVIMGVGEPLLNYDNLVEALEIICNPETVALAARRVTISTSGWVPGIRKLAKSGRQWNLAVSLHSADDTTRARLIPPKYRRSVAEILEACKLHREATGRLLTFEYVMLKGINDSRDQALMLARTAHEADAKVNLIPYNKANGAFERPSRDTVEAFADILKKKKVPVTIRVEKGFDSNAACGQLRSSSARRKEQA